MLNAKKEPQKLIFFCVIQLVNVELYSKNSEQKLGHLRKLFSSHILCN